MKKVDITKLSNEKSIIKSDYKKANDEFNNQDINQFFNILIIEAKVEFQSKRRKNKS